MIHNGMSAADLTGWRKATGSDAHNDYCVMLTAVDGQVGMCNSHDKTGPALIFTRDEMRAFVHGVKDGEFDDLI